MSIPLQEPLGGSTTIFQQKGLLFGQQRGRHGGEGGLEALYGHQPEGRHAWGRPWRRKNG